MTEAQRAARPGRRATDIAVLYEVLVSGRVKAAAALLAMGTAAALTLALAVWAMPWVPVGMTQDDYTPSVRVSALLTAGIALTTLVGAYLGGVTGREGGLLETLQAVLERRIRVRNRRQFRSRLVRECRRAHRDRGASLSLVLIRVLEDGEVAGFGATSALECVAQIVAATVRSSDVTGFAGDGEIGVLAMGADAGARQVIVGRLKRALAAPLMELVESSGQKEMISLGAVTLDQAGLDPDLLLADARASLVPIVVGQAKAAAA